MAGRRRLATLFAVAATVGSLVGGAGPASAAPPTVVSCGQTITADTTLAGDVGPCSTNGIVIGADGITLDLNGKSVFGTVEILDGAGVLLVGRSRVTVKNGTVRDFDGGVVIEGGGYNTVEGITARHNYGRATITKYGDGIAILSSRYNRVRESSAIDNAPYSGIGIYSLSDADHRYTTTGISSFNHVDHNLVKDNKEGRSATTRDNDGIRIEPSSTFNIISRNDVSGSALDGIALFGRSANNIVVNNYLHGNGFLNPNSRRGDGLIVFNRADNNIVEGNIANGNAANGIQIRGPLGANPGSVNNRIINNTASNNSQLPFIPSAAFGPTFDLKELNPNCGTNLWLGNTFGTTNMPACVQ